MPRFSRGSLPPVCSDVQSHDVRFLQPEPLEDAPAVLCIVSNDELIELRWLDACARQHGVGLATMMGLVLEEMRQHIVTALDLDSARAMDMD